jgi:molecular chaperone GrpE
MISKQLNEILEQEGLERILAEGEKFNPTLHEAFSQRETEEKADGTILKELERGYMFKGKMLRPSKVEVAKNPILKK